MSKFTVFVVEDDEWYRELLAHTLSLNPDITIHKFSKASDFLEALSGCPDAITLDYRLPDMEGTELFRKTRDIRDRLLNTINHIRSHTKLKRRVASLEEEVKSKYDFEKAIIGDSDAIKQVFKLLAKAIESNITVTITGETGTGKELAAKAIHYNSKRAKQPFVAVNMAAIPSELIESELFGHEKGAFTGASFQRIGKFEEADGGTLFLDEIGEMDPNLQVKLLRVLQEKEIVRIGSNKPVKVDCRIVVATHRDLFREVKEGRFREDLYYRLFGLTIEMPPLRQRDKDIILLAEFFITEFCRNNGKEIPAMIAEAKKKLMKHNYPGNVRELKSVVELATVMSDGNEITPEDINFRKNDELYDPPAEGLTLKDHTYNILQLSLKMHNYKIKDAAKELDISYSTIYRILKRES
ncbi:MAG: sigma-54 dependent transcriptional regulator [Cyclobacteriaceae bacterium]